MARIPLHVVILNWNAPADTIRCAKEVQGWESLGPEIWIVDNGSADDSVQRIRSSIPACHLLESGNNRGFGGGNNMALETLLARTSDDGCVLLLNNDALVPEEGVRTLIDAMLSDTRIAVVGPRILCRWASGEKLYAGGRDPAKYLRTYVPDQCARREHPNLKHPFEVDYVPGTVALMRLGALREVGLFDERYFFSVEMADLCKRLKNGGYRCVIAPETVATHDIRANQGVREGLHRYYAMRNRFLYIEKHFRDRRFYLKVVWTLAAMWQVVKSCALGRWARARALRLALQHGLLQTYGDQNALFLRPESKLPSRCT